MTTVKAYSEQEHEVELDDDEVQSQQDQDDVKEILEIDEQSDNDGK